MEAVIAMWEVIEYAKESNQDLVFVKVDFDKAYDRLEWSFILLSMKMVISVDVCQDPFWGCSSANRFQWPNLQPLMV